MDKHLISLALVESAALRDRAAELLIGSLPAKDLSSVDSGLAGRVDAILDGARCLRDENLKITAIKLVRGAFHGDRAAIEYLELKFPRAFVGNGISHGLGLATAKTIVEDL
jgi:hypothetical protein